ncbi:helix-turn-helix domain-containing protein [Allokutzneria multivorans]|uniref:Helix-turn-helix domain-containing protein n=1 Tax=Allokutzneria multivorans TaxID=1142134 RepID=A0ABP7QSJ4_9PSEU
MPRTRKDAPSCDGDLSRAFDFLGKRWNGVIIGTLASGPAGFAELKRAITGISDSMLSDRLTELTAAGLLTREVSPGPPLSVSYRLTTSGENLQPVLQSLADWAAANLPEKACRERC